MKTQKRRILLACLLFASIATVGSLTGFFAEDLGLSRPMGAVIIAGSLFTAWFVAIMIDR